jgi:hypothetical protein
MAVLTLRPNADSTPLEQSTQPAGDHYATIDEETLSETDYAGSSPLENNSTTAQTDIYSFPNHSSESGTINSVTVKLKAKYVLAGTCAGDVYLAPSVKIGSTVYNSSDQTVTSSTAEYSYAWTTNPATTAAWSWTEIDALLAGDILKGRSGASWAKDNKAPRCFQLWVEVTYGEEGGSPVFLPNIMKHHFIPPFIGGF